ncbi:MAG: 4-hydroxy-tetrahydrodipicolinate reductase [Gammaproteobacteria bacterium 39-13]|nr:4-hydroxy-tetrahydrodipicolinate reductase [Gammaproteobacteria bacterium]OJV91394.1 MAG: 4-hydroxy-tetrahydrodipicolinate reductase [Gammaproteobacteria bacterium 39-13]
MLRLAIAGCSGRMGIALIHAALASEGIKLTAATVSAHNPLKNTDVGTIAKVTPLEFKPVDDLSLVRDNFDTLIDFTTPEATMANLKVCQRYGKKMVIGTTGFNGEQKALIQEMSQELAIVFSPNMSIGVNLCFELLKQAAKVLGESVDIEIIEAHHRHKVDAPSGTALKMGEVICDVLDRNLEKVAIYDRNGITAPRERQTIGFSTIRAGDIVGEHTVMFAADGERVEISHRASSRNGFAMGAIRAAKWLESKKEGLYSMADVLFEKP